MSDRVTFRERASNGAEKDGTAVSVTDPRVKFIKGWQGVSDRWQIHETPPTGFVKCGDGTPYCMEVTVDQMAEIFYRAKRASFTDEGFIEYNWVDSFLEDGSDNYDTKLESPQQSFGGSEDLVQYHEASSEFVEEYLLFQYGYSLLYLENSIPANAEKFFKSQYSAGVYSAIEANDDERVLWIRDEPGYLHMFNKTPEEAELSVTAFSCFFSYDIASPQDRQLASSNHTFSSRSINHATPPAENFGGCESSVVFDGKVAWLDDTGSGNPLDPGNRRFIGVEFALSPGDSSASIGSFAFLGTNWKTVWDQSNANLSEPDTSDYSGCDLVIKLSGSSNTCRAKLYFPHVTYSPPPGTSVLEIIDVSDFVMRVTEWWPYATKDGSDYWSKNSGGLL